MVRVHFSPCPLTETGRGSPARTLPPSWPAWARSTLHLRAAATHLSARRAAPNLRLVCAGVASCRTSHVERGEVGIAHHHLLPIPGCTLQFLHTACFRRGARVLATSTLARVDRDHARLAGCAARRPISTGTAPPRTGPRSPALRFRRPAAPYAAAQTAKESARFTARPAFPRHPALDAPHPSRIGPAPARRARFIPVTISASLGFGLRFQQRHRLQDHPGTAVAHCMASASRKASALGCSAPSAPVPRW